MYKYLLGIALARNKKANQSHADISLESIIRNDNLQSLKSSLYRRGNAMKTCSCPLRLDRNDLHSAIEMACQYQRCEILEYLNCLVDHDDDVMERNLARQVRYMKGIVDECIPLVNCLVACATQRSPLDPQLLSWAIEHSSMKIFNALLVNKKSKHLDLNASEDKPSPIMACFRRPNLKQAHKILVHLWDRTLNQTCNVDPETIRDAVNAWITANGEIVTKYRKEIILKEIARIEDVKMSRLPNREIHVATVNIIEERTECLICGDMKGLINVPLCNHSMCSSCLERSIIGDVEVGRLTQCPFCLSNKDPNYLLSYELALLA